LTTEVGCIGSGSAGAGKSGNRHPCR
jgi:hypothetical protein